ncbi:MAG TPA: cupin domain-containing protein [Vicinamibacterales bacterium]|jgi:mannose-6-phosphate isomerase-like protein (cupin superfamily)|nr:cupin domain-containing protein [Vicinamibacterales bacterium]
MKRMRPFLCAALLGGAVTLLWQEQPVTAQATGLAKRIVHTDPATFRMSPAVHGGAGSMGFTALLNRGAVTPEFNFLHRGVIPPGAGIGHHFHNTVEEMFVILDGEAQFTIDGRTATVKGPAGVICRTGHSHAIYNASSTPVQWMNLNVSLIAGVYDAFDLGDTRANATLDPVPTFMTLRLDRALLRAPGGRGRGAAPVAPAANAVQSRRALAPSVFSTTWAYVDHVLVPPGGSTPELAHESVGEAYYVLAGSGTLTVKGPASETAPVRTGDAIPIRIGESSQFTNTGSEPLELFVMGVAKDMAAKTLLLSGGK